MTRLALILSMALVLLLPAAVSAAPLTPDELRWLTAACRWSPLVPPAGYGINPAVWQAFCRYAR